MAAKTFEDWWDSRGGGSFGLGVASGAWNAATKAVEAQSASNNSDLMQLLRDLHEFVMLSSYSVQYQKLSLYHRVDDRLAQLH